eukprot:c5660_g1_i1.p1 GENE.c5660_g1_i1~~c5660_g1_i1.p1  ORF type:complete len:155 (+),score=39.26 c5660_g1_i1:27-491(+)
MTMKRQHDSITNQSQVFKRARFEYNNEQECLTHLNKEEEYVNNNNTNILLDEDKNDSPSYFFYDGNSKTKSEYKCKRMYQLGSHLIRENILSSIVMNDYRSYSMAIIPYTGPVFPIFDSNDTMIEDEKAQDDYFPSKITKQQENDKPTELMDID